MKRPAELDDIDRSATGFWESIFTARCAACGWVSHPHTTLAGAELDGAAHTHLCQQARNVARIRESRAWWMLAGALVALAYVCLLLRILPQ